TSVTVTGASQAVTGRTPITLAIKNTTNLSQVPGPMQSDGSFSAVLPASPNDAITITATDVSGRVTGPLLIGRVPFGSQSQSIPITTTMSDAGFLARNVATSGNHLAVASY